MLTLNGTCKHAYPVKGTHAYKLKFSIRPVVWDSRANGFAFNHRANLADLISYASLK